MGLTADQQAKLDDLRSNIRALGRAAVAFSGGVDSAVLLKVCAEELAENTRAITARSGAVPPREIRAAQEFCREEGIAQSTVETHEFDLPGFDMNPPDRCYHCKREILSCIKREALAHGFETIVEGSNADDALDYRPGSKAVEEMSVRSPLRDANLTKGDVRAIAHELGLAVWDKPAFACLNTRFAYGEKITPERLAMVDAVEEALLELGFTQVRARFAGDTVRIELPAEDIPRAADPDTRTRITDACKQAGFTYASLDLNGYRTGSMNETLTAASE